MSPDPGRVLELVMQALAVEIAPNIEPAYAKASVGAQAMLLMAVREEFDRAAARRAEENAALRELFAEAVAAVADPALGERLDAAARETEASLRVPDLDQANASLRALLIELHAHVETLSTGAAKRIDAAIWAELARSTERRRLAIQAF